MILFQYRDSMLSSTRIAGIRAEITARILYPSQPFHRAKYCLVKLTSRIDRNNCTFEPVIIKIWLLYCILHRLYYNVKLLIYILNNYLGRNWEWLWHVFKYCLGIYLDELGKKVINAGQKDGCEYLYLVLSAAASCIV
jgi:hypothetical protein